MVQKGTFAGKHRRLFSQMFPPSALALPCFERERNKTPASTWHGVAGFFCTWLLAHSCGSWTEASFDGAERQCDFPTRTHSGSFQNMQETSLSSTRVRVGEFAFHRSPQLTPRHTFQELKPNPGRPEASLFVPAISGALPAHNAPVTLLSNAIFSRD